MRKYIVKDDWHARFTVELKRWGLGLTLDVTEQFVFVALGPVTVKIQRDVIPF